ncbi:MAG: phosphotransferase [Chloroflexota bacterium]|nr:MAG: hypothetical protein DIU68_05380 [Chloroflexota bacterium]
MLENTLAATYTPGVNLKHNVAGANWTFLLPRFALDTIVCYGVPGQKALKTLARISNNLVIVAAEASTQTMPPGVRLHSGPATSLPLPARTVDLIYIATRDAQRLIERDGDACDELARVLKADGFIYTEAGVSAGWLSQQSARLGQAVRYWLTPLLGEAQTAVPEVDAATRRYFVENDLFSSSVRLAAIGFGKRRQPAAEAAGDAANAPLRTGGRSGKRRLRQKLRPLAAALQQAAGRVEGQVHLLGKPLARRGVLIGPEVGPGIPQYLANIAAEAGVDLRGWRWGLAARGEYSSRKVLIFLFPPDEQRPSLIVKMVREAGFNARLENEYRALRWLVENGIGDAATLPQPVFSGYHGGLMLVGETIIDGTPFRAADGVETGELAERGLNWLVELATTTANTGVASAETVAAGLEVLLERYIEIYEPGAGERAFLAEQVDAIRRSRQPFPLVFQHGDPGVWNVIVTPDRRTAFLDWEAAEIHGMPLWDLFYYWRSVAIDVSRRQGVQDALAGFERQFLHESPLNATLSLAIRRVCDATGLSAALVRPLFYLCWMHRALKQATLLPRNQLAQSHYHNLLAFCIEHQDAPALAKLLLAGRAEPQVSG